LAMALLACRMVKSQSISLAEAFPECQDMV
jgi:hypothetical protein